MSGPLAEASPEPIVIGGPSSRLTLDFDPSTLPGGEREGRWPTATVAFDAPGIHIVGKFTFFPHDLAPFASALAAAHASLSGRATLESEDGDFSLAVEYANGGGVTVSGHLRPNLEDETVLNYRIATDQSYLASALLALKALWP